MYLLNSHLRFNFYSGHYNIKANRSFGLILHFFWIWFHFHQKQYLSFDSFFGRSLISTVGYHSLINDFHWTIRSCFDELIFYLSFFSSIFIFCEEDFKHLQRPIAGKRKPNVHKHMSLLGLWYCNSAEFAMLSSTPSLWIINHYGTLM